MNVSYRINLLMFFLTQTILPQFVGNVIRIEKQEIQRGKSENNEADTEKKERQKITNRK